MVLDPVPQSLPVHFFGSRPQPPTSPSNNNSTRTHVYCIGPLQQNAEHCNILQQTMTHPHTRALYLTTATKCKALQHTVAHCNKTQHTRTHVCCIGSRHHSNWIQIAKHCNTLRYTATKYNTYTHTYAHTCVVPGLSIIATGYMQAEMSKWRHCNTLQHPATPCNTLQHPTAPCNTLQHPATPCNTLQHPATHGNVLFHTATHCSILGHICVRTCRIGMRRSFVHSTRCNTLLHTITHCTTHVYGPVAFQ